SFIGAARFETIDMISNSHSQQLGRVKQLHVYAPAPEGESIEGLLSEENMGNEWLVTYKGVGAVAMKSDFTEADGGALTKVEMFDLYVAGTVAMAFEGEFPGEVEVTAIYIDEGEPVPMAEYKIKVYDDLSLELLESSMEEFEGAMQLHLRAPLPQGVSDTDAEWRISFAEDGLLEKTDRFTKTNGEAISDLEEHGIIVPGTQVFAFEGLSPGVTEITISCLDPLEPDEPLLEALFVVKVNEDLTLELVQQALDTLQQEALSVLVIEESPPLILDGDAQDFGWEVSIIGDDSLLEETENETRADGSLMFSFIGKSPGYARIMTIFRNGEITPFIREYTVKVMEDLSVKLLDAN
ncbi:MAG: hypothetical protein LBC41_03370, partial [Clostridiales bacterium]|nr:hypothetical protein [Clostridiales bacterium]